jgi:hypothetical protein
MQHLVFHGAEIGRFFAQLVLSRRWPVEALAS